MEDGRRDALRRRYDTQLRGRRDTLLPPHVTVEQDGPLLRIVGLDHRGFIDYRDLGGLEGEALDALIARQVEVFAARSEAFEWKLHGHDRPSDLSRRLRRAGLEPEEQETVLIANVTDVSAAPELPADVLLREVSARGDLERIAAMEHEIWGDDRSWLAHALEAELGTTPEEIVVVVAEAASQVICAGWVRFAPATDFASLWGGGTLPAWRGKGIYRALVAYRARLAEARGSRYLQVDASEDSRPILERLGFLAVTTTTPYVWSPPDAH